MTAKGLFGLKHLRSPVSMGWGSGCRFSSHGKKKSIFCGIKDIFIFQASKYYLSSNFTVQANNILYCGFEVCSCIVTLQNNSRRWSLKLASKSGARTSERRSFAIGFMHCIVIHQDFRFVYQLGGFMPQLSYKYGNLKWTGRRPLCLSVNTNTSTQSHRVKSFDAYDIPNKNKVV